MRKRIELTEEDKALFRDSVKGTRPLAQNKVKLQVMTPIVKVRQKLTKTVAPLYEILQDRTTIHAEDSLYFAKSGLQTKLLRKLQSGILPIMGKLDLHGFTALQAQQALADFLLLASSQGKRHVLIIHGKGRNNQAVLKNKIYYWLQQETNVLAFTSAQPRHGGTGAVYVILKTSL